MPYTFDGVFHEEIRQAFIRKRRELGVTYSQIGDLLGINRSTIRKWEHGDTTTCHGKYITAIQGFLNGAYDRHFEQLLHAPATLLQLWQHLDTPIQQCIERAITVYGLCLAFPAICASLQSALTETLNSAIRQILLQSGEDPDSFLLAAESPAPYNAPEES